jgi:2-polyprenyl-3-methyl-5-hydroxy-6-metoxy-1,4-benzoquinol methylase
LDALLDNYSRMVDPLYLEEEKGRRLSAKPILKELRQFKKKGRLLEIGCAAGFFLDEARKDGWDVYGVEISKWACDYARNDLGITNIFNGPLEKAGYPQDYFDAVVMKDVIEHLIDPKGVFAEIKRILKPGGMICVNTPDVSSLVSKILKTRWWGINQSHFYFFSRRSLGDMLSSAGLVPKKTKYFSRVFSLKYLAVKAKDFNKALYSLCMFLINRNIFKDALIKLNLRDQVEIYAEKKINE